MDAIVLRALEKEPEQRFASAKEMIAAIDRAAGHKPLEIEGGGRGRWIVVLLLLALLAAALVLGAQHFGR
jgi:hypothetical protein